MSRLLVVIGITGKQVSIPLFKLYNSILIRTGRLSRRGLFQGTRLESSRYLSQSRKGTELEEQRSRGR